MNVSRGLKSHGLTESFMGNAITKTEFFRRVCAAIYNSVDESDYEQVGLGSKLKFFNRNIFSNRFRTVGFYLFYRAIRIKFGANADIVISDMYKYIASLDPKLPATLERDIKDIDIIIKKGQTEDNHIMPPGHPLGRRAELVLYTLLADYILKLIYPNNEFDYITYLIGRLGGMFIDIFNNVSNENVTIQGYEGRGKLTN